MKALLVYDSVYGNTEKLARAIAEGIKGAVSIKRAAEVVPDDFNEIGLFLIGSPIQGGRPLKSIQLLINSLNGPATTGLPTATFDTRMTGTLPKIFGWAAKKMQMLS
jgi:flavodoxin